MLTTYFGCRLHPEWGGLNDVIIGAAPFVVSMLVLLLLLALVPGLALWLPKVVG